MSTKRIKDTATRNQQLTVAVRIRPIFQNELLKGNGVIAHKADEKMVVLCDPNAGDPVDVLRAKRAHERKYIFDWAFDGDSTQEEVYEKTTQSLVENVIQGFNGTIFAYGATGSGKTYTMVGEDENPGIMVRALKDLFKEVDHHRELKLYEVTMSYLEIYNENIRDLLMPSAGHLELREDARGNHQVVGLTQITINSSEQVMDLLTKGNKRRTQEPTGANKTSSRSHAVLMVLVKRKSQAHEHVQQVRTGRLFMVDLAGSERAAQTQNTGKRLVEGAHINKSLLALGNCINALAERNVGYVNFRDSKLTRLLKEPLTGNCKTVMVAHISPANNHFEESRNTLIYADRAKNITTKLKSNISDVSYHVAQYQTIISELRQEIERLRDKIQQKDHHTANVHSQGGCNTPGEKKLSEEEMQHLKQRLVESFNMQMEVRRRMMEIDNTLLGQSIEFDKLRMIINEWETEKAVTAMDNIEVERRHDGRRIGSNEEEMPDHVRQAWEDLQFLQSQHQRYLQMREDAKNDYIQCKRNTYRNTESLPDKASCQEQRELLNLLTRVYELEVEKMEMQASQLLRDHELRCRDLMILRYDRQRQLCDEIITRQRQLIDAMASGGRESNAAFARRELNELYRIYQQEIHELSYGRDSGLRQIYSYSNPYRSTSVTGLRPLGTSGSMLELHQLDTNKMRHSSDFLPPINSDGEERLFSRRGPPIGDYRTGGPRSESTRSSSISDMSIRSHASSEPTSPSERAVSLPPLINSDVSRRNVSDGSSRKRGVLSPGQDLPSARKSVNDRRSVFSLTSNKYTPPPSNHDRKRDTDNDAHVRRRTDPQRYGILPSLRPQVRKGASSDSETSKNNRKERVQRQHPLEIRRQWVEDRHRTRPYGKMVEFAAE